MGTSKDRKGAPRAKALGAPVVFTIYCHTHTETGRRYVGLTKLTMMKRWNRHVHASGKHVRGFSHFANAIRVYGKDAFSHEVLEVCHDLEVANLAEESWIEFYDTRNPEKGFNLAKVGAYTPHPVKNAYWQDPEYRAKQLPRLKALANDPILHAAMRAGMATPESKSKRSASSKALWADEHRARMSVLARESNSRPEVREKNAAAHRGKKLSSEHIEKCASSKRGKPLSEVHRQKVSESLKGRKFTVEHLANISKVQIGRKLSREAKDKIAASHRGKPLSPEHRAKIAASLMERKKAEVPNP